MRLTEEDVQRVLRIVDALDYREIRLRFEGLDLLVRKGPGTETLKPVPMVDQAPADPHQAAADSVASGTQSTVEHTEGRHLVRSPITGTVYYAPQPGAPPYVQVGQQVSEGDTVCLVEVMKLFQSVAAGIAGRIVEILAGDGKPVSEGQPLLVIESEQPR